MDAERLERVLASLHETDSASPVLRRLCVVGYQRAGSDGAGISRVDGGEHRVLASTGRQADDGEWLQAELGEGPCVDAIALGRPALGADLSSEGATARWPRFSPRALDCGVSAAFAFPLVSSNSTVGALDVYAQAPRRLEPSQIDDLLLVADLAAIAVDGGTGSPSVDGTDLWAAPVEPWAHPAVVHHAAGMIAAQLDIGVDEALLRLRAWAFACAQPVNQLARDIVERRVRAQSWNSDE